MRTIIIDGSEWYSLHCFLNCGIVSRVLRAPDIRIVLLAREALIESLRQRFSDPRVEIVASRVERIRRYHAGSRWRGLLSQVARMVLNGKSAVNTALYRERQFFDQYLAADQVHAFTQAYLRVLVMLCRRFRGARIFSRWLADQLSRARFYDDLLAGTAPSLIVVPSLGWIDAEAQLIREARRNGIRSVGIVINWDNTTNKGTSMALPDHAIVWSPEMLEEAVDHHDMARERISVSGVVRYDLYFDESTFEDRAAFLRRLGLDPARKTILFAANSPRRFVYNAEIAELLAQWAAGDQLGAPAQVIVRLHPNHLRFASYAPERSAVERKRLAGISARTQRVAIIDPKGGPENATFVDLDSEDSVLLANLIRHSDVVVCFFSTINLEAALLDKPIINCAAFGMREFFAAEGRDLIMPNHLERMLAAGGSRVATAPDELREELEAYLRDPGRDREGRRRVWQRECGNTGGRASDAVAQLLVELASRDAGVARSIDRPPLNASMAR